MKKVLFLMLGVFALSICSPAQEYQEGIPWGNAYFRPSVEFIYTHSDNIFRNDESMGDIYSDNFWMIRPQLGLEFPFENSYVKLQAQYEYKDYDDYEYNNHDSWFVTLDSQFKFSNGSTLTLKDNFVNGVQQTEQFDPDSEVYWNSREFTRNQATLMYEIPVSQLNSLAFHVGSNIVEFDDDVEDGALPFYSYDMEYGGVAWKYHYQPLASLLVEYEHVNSSPRADEYPGKAISIKTTEKVYNEDRVSIGWEGSAKRKVSGFAKVGYKKMKFDDFDWMSTASYDDYKGLVIDTGLNFRLSEFTDLNTNLYRHAGQSGFNVNNYYTSTGADIRLHHQFNRHFFATLGAKYQENDYPEAIAADVNGDGKADDYIYECAEGQFRNDKITQYLAELGYHFTSRIALRFNYMYENRDSSVDYLDMYDILRKPYTYSENRFLLQLQMGW